MAVLAGAGLTPSAAAEAEPPSATTTTSGLEPGDLRLDRDQAQRARDRVARILTEQPEAAAALGRMSPQAATVTPNVARHYGGDRYGTASELAENWWVDYFWNPKYGEVDFDKVVVVASGHTYADALSGGAAAAAWGGPLLLTRKDGLPAVTRNTINRLKPDAIMVLGGTGAVSAAVENELGDYAAVTRIVGKDRYDVSASLARRIGYSETAFVASGRSFPDGLAGGAAAGQVVAPLLITQPGDVPPSVMDALRTTVLPRNIYVLGGSSAVNEAVLTELRSIPGVRVHRVSGGDRYEVAANVADLYPTTYGATVAFGGDFPDALAGSAFAGLVGDKLLLVRETSVPGPTSVAMKKHRLFEVDLLGGPGVVKDAAVQQLKGISFPAP